MKVAIVHYWLINMRGGEKMLEALLELYPEADIYTHVYNPRAVSPLINSHKIYTSYIQKLPFAKKLYQKYMPLMPNALNGFNLQDYDLIISSEAGPAKGIVPNPDAYHICYCHSPMRYLWDMYHEYFRGANPLVRFFMKHLIPGLRLWDVTSANMVDRFITNSSYVAKRIKRYYNRDAEVVYGPAAIEKFLPVERRPEDFYLFFGQLTGYKRADIAIEACIRSGRKLLVAGSGAAKKDIRRGSSKMSDFGTATLDLRGKADFRPLFQEPVPKLTKFWNRLRRYEKSALVSFLGRVSDEELLGLFSRARALIFPGIEDLGLVPIEANAAGCPVIAYRKGGVLNTVREGVTGLFFDEQNPESLIGALDAFEKREGEFSGKEQYRRQVEQFSKEAFKNRIRNIITERKKI